MRAKYRIVTYSLGYEVQFKPWWSPFWFECSRYGNSWGTNYCSSIAEADLLARKHAQGYVVKDLGKLP